MQYLVGYGGGTGGYSSRGIPASWLISADGKVLYEGHPNGIKHDLIEDALKKVRPFPEFKISDSLAKAKKKLDQGKLTAALKALDSAAKDEALAAEAAAAKEAILSWGRSRVALADRFADTGDLFAGQAHLAKIKALFKGTEVADAAKKKVSEWKKDSEIKTQMKAEAILAQAITLLGKAKLKKAKAILNQLSNSKKYKDTKAGERARLRLQYL